MAMFVAIVYYFSIFDGTNYIVIIIFNKIGHFYIITILYENKCISCLLIFIKNVKQSSVLIYLQTGCLHKHKCAYIMNGKLYLHMLTPVCKMEDQHINNS